MSPSEIASSEIVVEVPDQNPSPEKFITVSHILESLPGNVYQKISKSPTGIANKLRAAGIDYAKKDKIIFYLESQKAEIIAVLSQVAPPVPDSIERAGGVQAYEKQLAENHRRSGREFVPTIDETIL